jgi:hypothetical protein
MIELASRRLPLLPIDRRRSIVGRAWASLWRLCIEGLPGPTIYLGPF